MRYVKCLILLLFIAVPFSAQADRPLKYDPTCFVGPNGAEKLTKHEDGTYTVSRPKDCRAHGTRYRVRLNMGSIAAGQVTTFRYNYLTLAEAETKKAKLDAEFKNWRHNQDVWTVIDPISY